LSGMFFFPPLFDMFCLSNFPSHKLTGTIAFNAPRFQPSFASHLLLSFTERVLVGRCPLRLAFKDMLAQACDLGRHSDVFLLTTDKEGALTCSRFAWANLEVRPWGHHLPIQCSGCGWANSWRSAYVKGSKDKSYIFECKNDSCNVSHTFSQPPGSTVLYSGRKNGGTWLDIPLETEFAWFTCFSSVFLLHFVLHCTVLMLAFFWGRVVISLVSESWDLRYTSSG
jgi:hypothetical protein